MCTESTRKMSKPYVIYGNCGNEEVYRRAMARMSLSDRMMKYELLITSKYLFKVLFTLMSLLQSRMLIRQMVLVSVTRRQNEEMSCF